MEGRIHDAVDLQFVWNAAIVDRDGAHADPSLRFRAKWNLLGNDEDGFALGLLPWVGLPPAGGEGISAGLAMPIALALPEGFDAGVQVEIDWLADGPDRHFVGLLSATTGHTLVGPLSAFAETVLRVALEREVELDWSLNGGLVVELSSDVRLDGGVRVHPLYDAYFEWWIGGSARGGM